MYQTHKSFTNAAIYTLLLYLQTKSLEAVPSKELCPIGYYEAYNNVGEPICYRVKGPETFADKFENCTGNQYSLKLLQSLNIRPLAQSIWTDYKNVYDGGPFVDWSYTSDSGDLFVSTYDVKRDSMYNVNEELCVVIDPVLNFTAVRCDEKHYRYCFIDVYEDPDEMRDDGCDSFNNFDPDPSDSLSDSELLQRRTYRFWSPMPTCLLEAVPKRGNNVRMTWDQSQKACELRGGSLLNRGWRYSNYPLFTANNKDNAPLYPFGVRVSADLTLLRYDADHDNALIPKSEWNFIDRMSYDTRLGALNYTWRLVNSSFIFFDVICEKTIPLRHVNLSVFIDNDDKDNIILTVDDRDLQRRHIYCFTDSATYYPQRVKVIKRIGKPGFILKFIADGYYWCTHKDTKNFYVSESNKILHIKVKDHTENLYAVKLTSKAHDYDFNTIAQWVQNDWKKKIEEYVFYSTKYRKTYGPSGSYDNHTIWQFRNDRPVSDVKNAKVVVKRLFLNQRSALLHVLLHPSMLPVAPGQWDDIQIDFMRPAYFCEQKDPLPGRLALGETKRAPVCKIYKCVGDFNEGVQLIITAEETCYTPKPLNVSSSVSVADVTTEPGILLNIPTVPDPPKSPEELLDIVIHDLNTLLNQTQPILVTDLDPSFDQVDGFLADNENVDIPGDLLHLLDELGARIELNGTEDAATVRDNVALLVADAQPSAPVRGLKIATRSNDTFTQDAFVIIRDDINNSVLMSDTNEVVIDLPDSVAVENKRISFVIFRNDRAFQGSHGLYSVNSRVLSVNIENTKKFEKGEFIDIYLTPLNGDPDRNQSRTCAFWKFLNDDSGSGYWSQDGCTFIRSTTAGMLDSCRCDHLTHFAEVLIPRTVFSERSENALEIISIVGCFMSIFGLIWVGITAVLFRSWRRDYSNKIWLQLCISIFIMSFSFLVIIFAHFEEYDVMCMLTGIVLHFSVLSSFCWMLVAAVLSYRRLVTVFSVDKSHKLLRASAFAWGFPCAVVGILLSVAPHSYSGRFDDKNPTTAFCYPSGLALWLSVFAPLAVMLIANWTLFALIVRSVFASRRNHPNRIGNRHSGDKNEALRCASVSFFLVFLFGLPWLLGLFSMNVVMAYCFVFLSTFQGFVLFLFFVLGNKQTRDLWLNKLKIKQTRKIPVTSSTYNTNNRSTGGNANSRTSNPAETIETKISKPRSLVSLDDSRFS